MRANGPRDLLRFCLERGPFANRRQFDGLLCVFTCPPPGKTPKSRPTAL